MGRPNRQAERRRDIMDAAIALIERHDLATLKLSDVAAELGLTTNAVRYYFKDMTQLLSELALRSDVRFFEERLRLGDETQRQLSDLAIGRATILLFGLFCRVIMTTYLLRTDQFMSALCAVRYLKSLYTFSDSNDLVREHLWSASETL